MLDNFFTGNLDKKKPFIIFEYIFITSIYLQVLVSIKQTWQLY